MLWHLLTYQIYESWAVFITIFASEPVQFTPHALHYCSSSTVRPFHANCRYYTQTSSIFVNNHLESRTTTFCLTTTSIASDLNHYLNYNVPTLDDPFTPVRNTTTFVLTTWYLSTFYRLMGNSFINHSQLLHCVTIH